MRGFLNFKGRLDLYLLFICRGGREATHITLANDGIPNELFKLPTFYFFLFESSITFRP